MERAERVRSLRCPYTFNSFRLGERLADSCFSQLPHTHARLAECACVFSMVRVEKPAARHLWSMSMENKRALKINMTDPSVGGESGDPVGGESGNPGAQAKLTHRAPFTQCLIYPPAYTALVSLYRDGKKGLIDRKLPFTKNRQKKNNRQVRQSLSGSTICNTQLPLPKKSLLLYSSLKKKIKTFKTFLFLNLDFSSCYI